MSILNKESYRELCVQKAIPLFMQAWWMDAVCGVDNWDVLLSEKEGVINGAMPYLLRKKGIFKCIVQPQLTQFNGVWIDCPKGTRLAKKCQIEQSVMNSMIDQINQKKIHYFNQNFHYSVSNWDPFILKGFSPSVRYTYVLSDISNLDKVYKSFSYAKQKHIKKSEGKLELRFDLNPIDFYNFHTATLAKKGGKIVYSKELFIKMYEASIERNAGQIMSVVDEMGNLHAALFIVWDKQSAYYLISAIDSSYKSSGASTLMVWEAIKFLSDKTKVFDFEGSMIKSVAKSFKDFGSVQKSYVNLTKNYSSVFKLLMKIRNR